MPTFCTIRNRPILAIFVYNLDYFQFKTKTLLVLLLLIYRLQTITKRVNKFEGSRPPVLTISGAKFVVFFLSSMISSAQTQHNSKKVTWLHCSNMIKFTIEIISAYFSFFEIREVCVFYFYFYIF